MRTIQKNVFSFEELSDSAKERARQWWRQCETEDFDVDFIYDIAADAADLLGLDIRQTLKKRVDGTHYYKPTIYYSGFCSQGDGACFEGSYKYKTGSLKAITKEFPKDLTLQRIARDLQAIQKRHFYKLTAETRHRGRYYHSRCMSVDVEHSEDRYRDIETAESDITKCLRDFADWIYSMLREDYAYRMSDECIDEHIICNEYEFDENGNIN